MKGNNVASGDTVRSPLEVGKDGVLSPNKETVQDEVDIMVDAVQRARKRFVNLAKQDPGMAEQKS